MIPVFRDVAIIGGGCYGTFYAGQLAEARDRGKVEYRKVLVVDHDPACRAATDLPPRGDRELVVSAWDAFLDRFLDHPAEPDDAVVPSPLMPHLMATWLERDARSRWPGRTIARQPLPAEVGTPYESTGPDGTRYLSFADWICPVHCIEPLTCPVIRAPRTWELTETLAAFSEDAGMDGCVTFLCRHQVFGVGMFLAAEALAAREVVRTVGEAGAAVDLAVGTVSRCHGAVATLHLGIFPPMGATT